MTARVLSVIVRAGGAERLCVTQQISGDVELSEESCVIDGWRLRRRIVLHRSELAPLLDALLDALKLGRAARPTLDDDASDLAGIVGPGELVTLSDLGPTPCDRAAVERLRATLTRNEERSARRGKSRR